MQVEFVGPVLIPSTRVTGIGIVALCIYRRNFRAIVSVLLIDVKVGLAAFQPIDPD